jgi:histidine decarboxylase
MGKRTEQLLDEFEENMKGQTASMLGYPINTKDDFKNLYRFFDFSLINLGDPFVPSSWRINSENFEVEALRFFASLYKMPKDDFWGYLSSGGTESNMYGIFLGRQLYPDGILYFSKDTHYSIAKIARLLNIKPVLINSQDNGEIDYQDLEKQLMSNKTKPPILNLNIGTTMKGAIDNVEKVINILQKNSISRYHIHCDAALFGMFIPFLKNAPKVDFTLPIGSLAISGHKFIGTHIPCGIALARKNLVKKIEKPIDYIGSVDTTIAGCRNGHTPLFLWYAIKTRGAKGFAKEANVCINNAKYLYERLKKINWPCFLNPCSNTVLLKKPSDKIARKWQLAISENWAHVVVMQPVTKQRIDAFVKDLD